MRINNSTELTYHVCDVYLKDVIEGAIRL